MPVAVRSPVCQAGCTLVAGVRSGIGGAGCAAVWRLVWVISPRDQASAANAATASAITASITA